MRCSIGAPSRRTDHGTRSETRAASSRIAHRRAAGDTSSALAPATTRRRSDTGASTELRARPAAVRPHTHLTRRGRAEVFAVLGVHARLPARAVVGRGEVREQRLHLGGCLRARHARRGVDHATGLRRVVDQGARRGSADRARHLTKRRDHLTNGTPPSHRGGRPAGRRRRAARPASATTVSRRGGPTTRGGPCTRAPTPPARACAVRRGGS